MLATRACPAVPLARSEPVPDPVISKMGYALGVAQLGGKHPHAKPWKGEGGGVFEIVEDFSGDTYRAVYTVRFAEVIYVLHSFQKKSTNPSVWEIRWDMGLTLKNVLRMFVTSPRLCSREIMKLRCWIRKLRNS